MCYSLLDCLFLGITWGVSMALVTMMLVHWFYKRGR